MGERRKFSWLANRLKSSSLRRAYWAIAKPTELAARRREEYFYRALLTGLHRGEIVFDIGANDGSKADIFLTLGAHIIAVEPDIACQRILQDRFLRYRLRPKPVTVIGKAMSDRVGTTELLMDGPASAVNTMSRKWAEHLRSHKQTFRYGHCGLNFSGSRTVDTTTLDTMMSNYGRPFFVKIDVEGNELNVLRGMHRAVPFLSFEINLPVFRPEGIECIHLLHGLDPDGEFNYTADCCSGLALKEWVSAEKFCFHLDSCRDDSIEVFWRSTSAASSAGLPRA